MSIHRRLQSSRRPARQSRALVDPLESRRLFAATPLGTYALGTSTTLTDADGTVTKFALSAGKGSVTVADDGWHVSVSSATPASTLTLTTSGGDGRVTLNDITSSKPLTLVATKAGLTGTLALSNVKSVTLGTTSNLSIASSSPITSLTVSSWADTDGTPDTLSAPSITSLSVKGNFAPNLTLSSKKVALNSATIGGTLTGTWAVAGSAGTLKLHAVRSPDLTISGNVTQLTLDDYVALSQGASSTGGVLHFGGKGSVSAAKGQDKFKVAKNVTLYTCTTAIYNYSELTGNTQLGAKHTYRRSGKIQVTQISDQTQKVNGVDAYIYSSPGLNGETDTYSVDSAGTHLLRQNADSDAVNLGATFSASKGLLVAPAILKLGATTRGSSPLTLGVSDDGVGGTLHGSAASATRFAGHELITLPAGTFLAAKVITTLSFSSSGTIGDGQNSAGASVSVGTSYTQWFVPGLGAVRVDTARSVTVKVPEVNITRKHNTVTKDELSTRPATT